VVKLGRFRIHINGRRKPCHPSLKRSRSWQCRLTVRRDDWPFSRLSGIGKWSNEFSTAPVTRTFYVSIYSTDWHVFILLVIRKSSSCYHLRLSSRTSAKTCTIDIRSVWQNHGTVHRRKSVILSIASCISPGFLRQRGLPIGYRERSHSQQSSSSRRNGCGKLSAPERKQHAEDFSLGLHLLD
jgi:hypothetical protein